MNISFNIDDNNGILEIKNNGVSQRYLSEQLVQDRYYELEKRIEELEKVFAAFKASNDIMRNEYSIYQNLSNVMSTNGAKSIRVGETYTTTLLVPEFYRMFDLCIQMGGNDITSYVFNTETNEISIPSVCGNIAITATSKEKLHNVKLDLSEGVLATNIDDGVYEADNYVNSFEVEEGYELKKVQVFINGKNVSGKVYDKDNNQIEISNPDGDITIVAKAEKRMVKIEYDLSGLTMDNLVSEVPYGSFYESKFVTEEGYRPMNILVTIDGVNKTLYTYWARRVKIDKVTGNVVITAISEKN